MPLPHLRRDWAHPCHICTGTGLTPAFVQHATAALQCDVVVACAGEWAHMACAQWIPEVYFGNDETLEPINGAPHFVCACV